MPRILRNKGKFYSIIELIRIRNPLTQNLPDYKPGRASGGIRRRLYLLFTSGITL